MMVDMVLGGILVAVSYAVGRVHEAGTLTARQNFVLAATVLTLLLAFPASADHKKRLHEWRLAEAALIGGSGQIICIWQCQGENHPARRNNAHVGIRLGIEWCIHEPVRSRYDDRVLSVEDEQR